MGGVLWRVFGDRERLGRRAVDVTKGRGSQVLEFSDRRAFGSKIRS
jgi:hypothetical protein